MARALLSVGPPRTQSMTTADGVRLDADVYRPDQEGAYPVLLMRQPYGRAIASTLSYAHPSWYAARGYIVVIQDVRGRGTSQGDFDLFVHEASDGAQSVAWAAALPGANGAVGMYGFSYQGVTQLLAAAQRPPALKAVAPAMIGWDLGSDWAYENGAFCLSANIAWAVQLAAEGARLAGDAAAFAELFAAGRQTPLNDPQPAIPDVLQRHAAYAPYYARWLSDPPGADYWATISPAAQAETLVRDGPPALFIGGWYDTHLPGTVAGYRAYTAGRDDSRLIVGPWAHFPWGRSLAGEDFGDSAIGQIDQLQLAWFDHWLKGEGQPIQPSVRLFDMGAKVWRDHAAWPNEHQTTLFLSGGGRVALDDRDGQLVDQAPVAATVDPIVHDPWRPVPAVGGAFNVPAGPVERTSIDARPDVLTYTTAPLAQALTIQGNITAHLTADAGVHSFDLACTLSRVTADNRAFLIAEGYRHLRQPTNAQIDVPLRPTCMTIAVGERLRLSIAAAAFPNHPVNPGTGADPVQARLGDHRIVTLQIHSGGAAPSRLTLST